MTNTDRTPICPYADTAENLELRNDILLQGQIVYNLTNNTYKVGDGVSRWTEIITEYKYGEGGNNGDVIENLVGQMTENNGEIFNDYENNQALSKNSHAEGENTNAGTKGFKIASSFTNDGSGTIKFNLNSSKGLNDNLIGTPCTLRVANEFSNGITISAYDTANKTLTLKGIPAEAAYESESDDANTHTVENYIVIHGYPELGDIDIGQNAHASGYNTYAQGRESFVAGRDNKVVGQYGTAIGRQNESGYCSFVSGRKNKAKTSMAAAFGLENTITGVHSAVFGRSNVTQGENSVTMGLSSKVTGNNGALGVGKGVKVYGDSSMAEGIDTETDGIASHASGIGTIAETDAQFVIGKYNKRNKNSVFVVGSGEDNDNRSDIHTLDWNGNAWFAGEITVGEDKKKLVTETELNSKLSLVHKYKGSVNDCNVLPEDVEIGDVYKIEHTSEMHPDTVHLTLITGLYNMDSENGIYLEFQSDNNISFKREGTFFFKESNSAPVYPSIEIEASCIKYSNHEFIELQFSPNNLNYDLIKDIFFPEHVINPDGGTTEISEAYPCEIWKEIVKFRAGDSAIWTGTSWDVLPYSCYRVDIIEQSTGIICGQSYDDLVGAVEGINTIYLAYQDVNDGLTRKIVPNAWNDSLKEEIYFEYFYNKEWKKMTISSSGEITVE